MQVFGCSSVPGKGKTSIFNKKCTVYVRDTCLLYQRRGNSLKGPSSTLYIYAGTLREFTYHDIPFTTVSTEVPITYNLIQVMYMYTSSYRAVIHL